MRGLLRLAMVPAAAAAMLFAADPFIGTWKLNVAKSTFDPMAPPVRGATRSYQRAGKGVHVVWDIELQAGATQHGEYTARCDAKPHLAGASESISCKQVNERMVEGVIAQNGAVSQKYDRSVSKDGQTMTLRFFAPDKQGAPVSVQIYERLE